MAAGEESRKLMCECGKQLGTFRPAGLELHCRFCKMRTVVPYGLATLRDAIAWVIGLRRRFRP